LQHIFRMYDWMYNSLCLWLDLQTSTVAWVASMIEHKVLYLQSDLLTSTYKLDYYKLGGCTNCRISGSSSTAVLSLDIMWFLTYGHEFVVGIGWCMSYNSNLVLPKISNTAKLLHSLCQSLFHRTKICAWLEQNDSSFVFGFSGLLCVEWAIFRVSSFSHQICGSFFNLTYILYSYLNPPSGADGSAEGIMAAWHWP